MTVVSFDFKARRFDIREEDELIIRWDVHVIQQSSDWVEVYTLKMNTEDPIKDLIFSAPLDQAVEFFEKILGYLRSLR